MKKVLLTGLLIFSFTTFCIADSAEEENNTTASKAFNWEPVIAALMTVESNNNPNAKSGRSAGILQITPILVQECNQILKRRGLAKRFTLQDRYSVEKSKEMFLLVQSYFNPKNNVEYAIRSWKGGINYTVKSTQRYYEKVMRVYKK